MRKGWRQQPLVLGKHPDQTRWEGHVSRPQIPNVVSGVDPRPLPQAPERSAECSEKAGGFGNWLYMKALVTSVGYPGRKWRVGAPQRARYALSDMRCLQRWFWLMSREEKMKSRVEKPNVSVKPTESTLYFTGSDILKWLRGWWSCAPVAPLKPPIWSQDLVCQSKKEDAWRNISSSPKQIPSS